MARLDEGEIISHEYAAMNNKHLKDIFQAVMYFINYFNTVYFLLDTPSFQPGSNLKKWATQGLIPP